MRASLLLGFGSVVLLTALGLVVNNVYTGRRVVQDLASAIFDETAALAETKLEGFFGGVADRGTGTASSFASGLIGWGDWGQFRKYALPILEQAPHIANAGAGDAEGNACILVRQGTHWTSQVVRPAEWGRRTLWQEWAADGTLQRERWEESDYDPRQRPWFQGAVTTNSSSGSRPPIMPADVQRFWTSPYRFYTTGDYGVTVSARVPWTNALEAVVFFDVRLKELDDFVAANPPSEHGFTLILDDGGRVLGWPGVGEFSRDRMLAGEGGVMVSRERMPVVADVMESWQRAGKPARLLQRVHAAGEVYWVGFRSMPGRDVKLHALVAVPREDLLGEAIKERQRMAAVLGSGLLLAVALAFWLASVVTRPLAKLVERSEAIERLELTSHARVASRVLEVQRLSQAQSNMVAALDSFGRYVPREVIAELLRQGEAAKVGAHPARLTILFSDIRRFTAISEGLPPDDVAKYLSEYFDALHSIIERHQGTTDKFIGDAIMAFWGAPRPDPDHARNAVEAVLVCRDQLRRLNDAWKAEGRPEFETNFGLACGPVVVGNIGAANRLNYTVMGSTVNLASRLVGLGREVGCSILAAESVTATTAGQFEWRRVGPVEVRGLSKPMMVCEPLGRVGQVATEAIAFKREYERALDAYLSKDFAAALDLSRTLLAACADDASVRYLHQRCETMAVQAGPGVDTGHLVFRKAKEDAKTTP